MKREHHSATNVFEGRTLEVLNWQVSPLFLGPGFRHVLLCHHWSRVARHRPVLSRSDLKYVLMTLSAFVKRRSGKSRPRPKIRYIQLQRTIDNGLHQQDVRFQPSEYKPLSKLIWNCNTSYFRQSGLKMTVYVGLIADRRQIPQKCLKYKLTLAI